MVYKCGNYYNRLLIDVLIAKKQRLGFWDTVYMYSFIYVCNLARMENFAIVEPLRYGNYKHTTWFKMCLNLYTVFFRIISIFKLQKYARVLKIVQAFSLQNLQI